jgi:hypothetical protein
MAEPLAVVGIVASIAQLIVFGSQVLERLEEYQSKLGDIPKAFRHIKTELPVLLDALQRTKASIDAGPVQGGSRDALLPAIEGCLEQIKVLDDVIAKALPTLDDSRVTRSKMALKSLWYESKAEKITRVIRGYIQTLTYHAAASSSPLPGITLPISTLSICKLSMLTIDPARPIPVPSSTVPFRRDKYFVDRRILSELFRKRQQSVPRVALVGLGGIG